MKVIILCAVTLDGKIARNLSDKIGWTSKEDKKMFARETKKAGVIIMGHNTFKTFGHPLKERLNVVLTSRPQRRGGKRGVLEFTNKEPQKILHNLSRRGFKKLFVIGGAKTNSLFLKAGLVNEIWLTIAPRVFGRGLNLLKAPLERNLALISLMRLSPGFLFVKYRVL